ncbi:MAG: hypothetical protein Q4P17_06815 [Methanobacterium sp.]|nr:hypothetical protein [Methanobacterium sp.]
MGRARGILGSIRTIMVGNAYGIPWSSFFNRLRGRADPRSNLWYELRMMLGTFLMPVSVIHALISSLFRRPVTSF